MSYDLLRGVHIIALVAWMAGLLILPRLFVYSMRAQPGSEIAGVLDHAQDRLLKLIMNPAMLVTWVLGLALLWTRAGDSPGVLLQPWLVVKLAGVVLVTGWHFHLAAACKRFAAGRNTRSEKWWRMMNEVPFLAAIVMILAVTTEFGA